MSALLSERLDIAAIRGMDIPPPPAGIMAFETDNGRVEIPLSEIKPIIPETCFICPDMTSEFSDVSVGMFEGHPGWNTLVIRSKVGAGLVTSACDEGYLETKGLPPESIAQLTRAAGEKKARALRTLIRRNLINNENGQRSALRMPPDVVEKILTY